MLHGVREGGPVGPAGFEPAWEAAFAFADVMTRDSDAVGDAVYGSLAAHWDEGQIVEIAQVIGLFNYFNRFNNALEVEITR
jgi:alkylhydroperoxidase family enzyme